MIAARATPGLRALAGIFALALALRWAYALGLHAAFGGEALMGPDSHAYIAIGRSFAEAVRTGAVSGWAWLGPDLSLMPLFTWSVALHAATAGTLAPLGFTLVQGVFDAGTCVLAAGIAAGFLGRRGAIAGYAAALTPTLIVLSGLVYTDTVFVFFATAGLYAALRWIAMPSWRWALVIGLSFAFAAQIRIAGSPFVVAMLAFLLVVALSRRRLRWSGVAQLALAGALVALALAPMVARNVAQHGAWALTPQSGNHLANWILPLVREGVDGTPRDKTNAENWPRIHARFGPMPTDNPFKDSANFTTFARDELAKLGMAAIARAWLHGAAINLSAPAVVLVPPVSALPRTGFYDTPGRTFTDKVWNFLFRSDNTLYGVLLALGLAGVAAIRFVQLVGLVALLRRRAHLPGLMLLGGWCLYILLLNGPIASPKYRLPLEPVLALLTGAGAAALFRRRASAQREP